jgi:fumarate reductase subunit C
VILGTASRQQPWLAVAIVLAVAIGMSLLTYAFWRERGPRSWYAEDNYLLRYLGRGALVLSIFFFSVAILGSVVTVHRNHRTGAGAGWWTAALVIAGVLFALSALLMFAMWFTGKPRCLCPPIFRRPDRST